MYLPRARNCPRHPSPLAFKVMEVCNALLDRSQANGSPYLNKDC